MTPQTGSERVEGRVGGKGVHPHHPSPATQLHTFGIRRINSSEKVSFLSKFSNHPVRAIENALQTCEDRTI